MSSTVPGKEIAHPGRLRQAVFALCAAVGGTACSSRPAPAPVEMAPAALWMDDVGRPGEAAADEVRLQPAEAEAVLVAIRAALEAGRGPGSAPRWGDAAGRWTGDRSPRVVFVSASDGVTPARVAHGAGLGLAAATTAAVAALRGDAGANGPASELAGTPAWIKLDIAERVTPPLAATWDEPDLAGLDIALHGVAFGRDTPLALLPEELLAGRVVDDRGALRKRRLRAYLARGLHAPPGLPPSLARDPGWVRGFRTHAWLSDGSVTAPLYRGHRADLEPTGANLLAAARAGASYLTRVVGPDGRFVYNYQPTRDRADERYNMVRHAGTVYAMLEAWEVLRDPALLAAAERAIEELERHTTPWPEAGKSDSTDAAVLAYRGKIKLGGVALAALALAKHAAVTGQRTHLPLAQRLCRYIALSQRDDGSFVHQRADPGGEELDFVSEYYPGEALFALVRVNQQDGDPRWLEVAERGARYLIEVRDRGIATLDLTHDHWLLYALNELHAARPRALYLTHAMRIARAIASAQRLAGALPERERDHAGGFAENPRSAPVATRVEGMLAALSLARRNPDGVVATGERIRAADIRAVVERGARLLLTMQIGPGRAMYLPRPGAALGGLPRSFDDLEVRIDYVQHALSALLGLWRVIEGATAPSR